MPEDILNAAYANSIGNRPVKLDEHQNQVMAGFMRDLMRVVNDSPEIDSLECYHSASWDNDLILSVVQDRPRVEFWSVHAPYGRFIDPSSPDEERRHGALTAYSDAICMASKLGAKVVVAHPGANVEYAATKRERLKLAAEAFKEIADQAGGSGITVAIEPLPKQEPGNCLDEVLWLIERIDRPNVGINFDVNHLFPPESVPDLIRTAGALIKSVHISDQDGVERHWLPFSGSLEWSEVLSALVETGYRGPLIYETHVAEARTCKDVGRIVVENYRRLIALAPL
jgi:sugar phosphate isomerase/epimerase